MATSRTARNRPLVAWLFVIAGALLLIEFVITLVFLSANPLLTFLAFGVLTIAFLFLFLGGAKDTLLRVAFLVAAVGLALITLAQVIPGLGTVGSVASVLALVGTLGSGILVYLRHHFTRNADRVFLVTTIAAALLLLNGIRGILPGALTTILTVLFAAGLVFTGLLVRRRR
ncbi:MAG: hypothetical protein JWQ47_1152 [Glaciihabitans sp.]|jgi:hypothetical protein|nr:hypothetical protein [Glaciihabitans sp.]